MALATITETLELPANGSAATLRGMRARLRVVAADSGEAVAYSASVTTIAEAWADVGSDGTYSFTSVRPNTGSSGDQITTPAETVYELSIVHPSGRAVVKRYLDVPDSAGPHDPADIEVANPNTIRRWRTTDVYDVSSTAADADGEVLVWDNDTSTYAPGQVPTAGLADDAVTDAKIDSTVVATTTLEASTGYVETFSTTGLPSGWTDANDLAGQSTYWDSLEVDATGTWVIPDPDDGAAGQAGNSGARAAAYRDFSAYAWADDDVEVSITFTGEAPYEASPLLHVDPDHDGFGIGCWPIYDISPPDPPQSRWFLGAVGRRPDQLNEWAGYPSFTHPEGVPWRLTVRSSGGSISAYVNGELVVGPVDVPTAYEALLTSKLHGISLDNNQSDGNGGAGGTRPANMGAARGPFTVAPVRGSAPLASDHAVAGLAFTKADKDALAAHLADTSAAHAASAISWSGALSATDVDAALDELVAEKADLAAADFAGAVTSEEAFTVENGDAKADMTTDAQGSSGTNYYTAGETEPRVSVGYYDIGSGVSGIFAGPGGSTAPDTVFYRSAAGAWTLGTGKITGSGAPTGSTDLATKGYVDTASTNDRARSNHTGTQAGSTVDAASDTARGTVELATTAEATAGTDSARAVTAAGVAAYWANVLGNDCTFTSELLALTNANGTIEVGTDANNSSGTNYYRAAESYPRVTVGHLGQFSLSGIFAGAGSADPDTYLFRSAVGTWTFSGGGLVGVGKGVTFTEQSDPSAPAANNAVLYAKDNGSGKTQLCVRFPTGAVQVLATEP